MGNQNPRRAKSGPGRPQVFVHPVRKKITFEAAVLQMLEEASRTEGRSVPELIRRAVDTFLDPHTIALAIPPNVSEQLEAISRSAPHGRVSTEQMIRKAIDEFATARLQDPEVQAVLTTIRGAALRLVPKASRADESFGDVQNKG